MNTHQTILAIAMNLTHMGNWAADDFEAKHKRIATFLEQTSMFVSEMRKMNRVPLEKTWMSFEREFQRLEEEANGTPANTKVWAETMMTWGNILTHRAKLLK